MEAFFRALIDAHGPVVRYLDHGSPGCLVNEPALIEEVLVHQRNRFAKRPLRTIRIVTRKGLVCSEGALHASQRRIMQPMFTPHQVQGYLPIMAEEASVIAAGLQPGQVVDVEALMGDYALKVVSRSLVGRSSDSHEVLRLLHRCLALGNALTPEQDPGPELCESMEALDQIIASIIADHRERAPGDDLVAKMMRAGMDDSQLRDEIVTVLLAGHETTQTGLAWTWYLLSQNPEAERLLNDETDRVLDGRPMEADDLATLAATRRIVLESLRLFPPVWNQLREALTDVVLGDYNVPAGTMVRMIIMLVQRDPRFYPDPDRFDPSRWLPEQVAARPRFSFFPFGGGDRVCLGETLAIDMFIVLLATLAQKWRFRMHASDRPLRPVPLTKHPLDPIYMVAEPR